ncbi:MAG TPA: threonine/serine exporter family protein [Thermoleophilia bacterium]|nr:threonine/serine exporter family protein [Thermoleophilia bacterium]HQG55208.1 threonine/serine exporter family protein [Thermoleophilia bacterium]
MAADPRIEFLSAMAAALSRYGETADGLEDGLRDCARRLGVDAEFFATPTAVFASFGPSGLQQTVLLRTREAAIDLRGLSAVHDVLRHVRTGEATAEQGLAELRLAMTAPPTFPWPAGVLGSAAGAASFDLLLGGTWAEAGIAASVGLAVGVLVVLGRRFGRLAHLTELLAGLLASLLALAWGHLVPDMSPPSVALASLILLLPGLGITLGVAELASRQLAAGTARLAGAAVTLLNLSIGSFLGTSILRRLELMPHTHVPDEPTTTVMLVAAAALSTVALLVATNSRLADVWLIAVSVGIALVGARFGAWLVGATLGVAVASLIVGLWSNGYGRLARRPAALALIPGLAVLVPGSLGYRGISAFLRESTGGLEVFGAVLVIAAGLVVGLLVADATLPPRGAEHP